jgi:hypothetical protein
MTNATESSGFTREVTQYGYLISGTDVITVRITTGTVSDGLSGNTIQIQFSVTTARITYLQKWTVTAIPKQCMAKVTNENRKAGTERNPKAYRNGT